MVEALAKLKASFGMPFSYREQSEIAVEAAHAERAIRS